MSETLNLNSSTSTASAAPTVDVVDLLAEFNNPLSTIRGEWLALFERASDASIFHHPDFVGSELNFLPRSRLPSLLLLCRQNGQLTGFAGLLPKVSSTHSVGGLGPSCSLYGYRLIGNGLLCGGDESMRSVLLESAMREVIRRGAGYLHLEDLDQSSSLLKLANTYSARGCGIYSPTGFQDRLMIQLPRTNAEYFGKFSSKTRYNLRSSEKKLGAIRVQRCSTVEQVPDFLRDAHQVAINSWQTEQLGLRVKNNAAELAQMTCLASHGALRSYLLYQGETPISFIIGNQYRGVYRYEEVGFDRRHFANSPGKILLIKVLEEMFADDTPDIFDFGLGEADYKRMFANIETKSGNIWLVPPGIKGRSLVAYLKGSHWLRQSGRNAVKVAGWYQKLRQKSRLGTTPSVKQGDSEGK